MTLTIAPTWDGFTQRQTASDAALLWASDGGFYSVLPCVPPADGSHSLHGSHGSDGSDGSHDGRARKGPTGRDSTSLCRQDAGSTFRRSIPTLGGYRSNSASCCGRFALQAEPVAGGATRQRPDQRSPRLGLRACLKRLAGRVGQASSLSACGLPARGTACLAWGWKPRDRQARGTVLLSRQALRQWALRSGEARLLQS